VPRVKVGDIHVYYESHGKGEPLVFINGRHMCQKLLWMHVPVFAREYRVITFDNRGWGKAMRRMSPISIEMMADDLAGLLDAIGIENAHLTGYSMGSKIAEDFAIKYSDRVISLMPVCYAPPNPDITHEPLPIAQRIKWLVEYSVAERARHLFKLCVSEEFTQKNPELAEKMIKIMIEGHESMAGQRRMVEASFSHNNYKRLPEIKAPTIVIAGGADITCPLEDMRSMAERIPGAELAVVQKGGHFLMWECFEESNRIMLNFLRRHRVKKA
jgi:3-oxoadipate enol-lactonase